MEALMRYVETHPILTFVWLFMIGGSYVFGQAERGGGKD